MGREIKFKLLYKHKSKLKPEILVKTVTVDWLIDNTFLNIKHFVILEKLQYTGLKDKNGVEIYEGDIVKARSRLSARSEPIEYQIAWDKSNCNFFGIAKPKFAFSTEDRNNYGIGHLRFDIEVIGNIYQNPELLENQND